jgi:hypothetical protein
MVASFLSLRCSGVSTEGIMHGQHAHVLEASIIGLLVILMSGMLVRITMLSP